jgi:hydrogenase nickel incorporation protein HypB
VTRIVEVREGILKKNDTLARALRTRFSASGVFVASLVSSPGSGKTALLQKTLEGLKDSCRIGALVGDLATDRDAARLSQAGVMVRQITTGTLCHLEAQMVEQAIEGWDLDSLDLLFIENVGNLVCPSSYDLGEHVRGVLLSVTEGEDKPLKYPTIFNTADFAVITKIDLADAVGFDRKAAYRNIHEVRPGMEVVEVSARTGAGMDKWLNRLRELSAATALRAPLPFRG